MKQLFFLAVGVLFLAGCSVGGGFRGQVTKVEKEGCPLTLPNAGIAANVDGKVDGVASADAHGSLNTENGLNLGTKGDLLGLNADAGVKAGKEGVGVGLGVGYKKDRLGVRVGLGVKNNKLVGNLHLGKVD